MDTQTKTIAVTDAMDGTAGRIVYWRLSGETDYDKLVDLWEDSDLADTLLPNPTTAERALRMAVQHASDNRLLCRPLGRSKGYALVQEELTDDDLEYGVLLSARLREHEGVTSLWVQEPAGAVPQPKLSHAIVSEYERRLDTLDSTSVSSWLAGRILPSVKAVSLRDRGGVYFIPAMAVAEWDSIVKILREASEHILFQIPAMRSADAVHAILSALTDEAGEILYKIETELGFGEEAAAELGKRAVATRSAACAELLEKLGAYESLLDTRLDSIRDRCGQAQVNLSTLALSINGD